MAEAGYPNGFETTLSFDLGFAGVNEPLCVLTQESLAQIGIKMHDQQDPGRELAHRAEQEGAAALHQRVLGLARLSRVLLHLVLSRQEFDLQHDELPVEGRWTASSTARSTAAASGDKASYDKDVKGFVDLAFADMPRIPLFQPYVNVAMQKNISGYQYWFHRRLDYRALVKGVRSGQARGQPMLSMILKRLLMAVPSLIGVVIVTFLLTRALPGDPAAYFAGPAATKEAIEQIRVKLGLDKPLLVQFVRYVDDLAHGDLGNSLTTGQPVGSRDHDPAAGLRRADAARPDRVDADRGAARHPRGDAGRAR